MTDAVKPLTRLQRFRRGYARIDYYPHQDSVAAIERLRAPPPLAILRPDLPTGQYSFEFISMDSSKNCDSWSIDFSLYIFDGRKERSHE